MAMYHVGLNIRDYLQATDEELDGVLVDDGRPLTGWDVREELIKDLRAGHDCYCPCDNRTAEGRCAGHGDEERASAGVC